MAKVVFIKDYATLKKGDVKDFSRDLSKELIKIKVAELYVKKEVKKTK